MPSNPNNVLQVLRSQFKITAVIDGLEYEVVHVVLNYRINDIPRATAMLAVGRDVRTLKNARIHDTANTLTALSSFQIVLEAEGEFAKGVDWPGGQHILFDGFVTGLGNRRSNDRTHAVVHGIHFLSGLAYSSALTADSHPTNPVAFSAGASLVIPGAGSLQRRPSFVSDTLGANGALPTQVLGDLWGQGLKKFLCNVTKANFIRFRDSECLGSPSRDNSKAQAALSRIEGASGDECDFPTEFGVASPLNVEGGVTTAVASAVAKHIGREGMASWAGTTLWNKLLQYNAAFMLATIPMARRALVVPFTPSFRTPWATVELQDYTWIDQNLLLPRPIKSVAIYGTKARKTGLQSLQTGSKDQPIAFGGCFVPQDIEDENGVVLIREAPFWLAQVVPSEPRTRKSSGTEGRKPANTDGNQPSDPSKIDGNTAEDTAFRVSPLYARYAQAIYFNEVLRGRAGSFSGKVRFDIAPGSSIRIEGVSGQFVGGDALTDPIYATVTAVTVGLNAEQSTAATGYEVAFIRNERENESEAFSTDQHPLYSTNWFGAPLVETLSFR